MIYLTTEIVPNAVSPYLYIKCRYLRFYYNDPSHFYLCCVVLFAIEHLMPCGSIVNKSTGQVCRPAENTAEKN